MYENIRPPFGRLQQFVRRERGLECTHGGGTDRTDAMSGRFRLIDHPTCSSIDPVIFGIHLVFAQVLHFDGAESAQSCVQGYLCKPNALDLETLDQFYTEVKARCRCRYRTFVLRINRLITDPVLLIRLPPDQLWQRSLPKTGQNRLELIL